MFGLRNLIEWKNTVCNSSAVFKGIPDEPGRLCDGETSKWI